MYTAKQRCTCPPFLRETGKHDTHTNEQRALGLGSRSRAPKTPLLTLAFQPKNRKVLWAPSPWNHVASAGLE